MISNVYRAYPPEIVFASDVESFVFAELSGYSKHAAIGPYTESVFVVGLYGVDSFRPEAESTLFLRMRTEEIDKTLRKCIPTAALFPYYR